MGDLRGLHRGAGQLTAAPPRVRRRLNGFTAGMKRDLIEVLLQCQMSNEVRVIIIVRPQPQPPARRPTHPNRRCAQTGSTANGRGAFCAGDDTMGKPGYTAESVGVATGPIHPG